MFTTAVDAGLIAQEQTIAVVPVCQNAGTVWRATALQCTMVTRILSTDDAVVLPEDWTTLDATPPVLVADAVSATNVARIVRTPVATIGPGYVPVVAGRWTMASLITQACAVRNLGRCGAR